MRIIEPYNLNGQLLATCSKSYLQRALAITSFADSASELENVCWSSDSEAALNIAKQLGISARMDGNILYITPGQLPRKSLNLECNESGLSLRIFSFIAALFDFPVTVSGSGSLLNRPILPVIRALEKAGVEMTVQNKTLPLIIKGPMKAGEIRVDGSFSSQIISGLLITLPLLPGDSQLEVMDVKSIPYIEMTMEIMNHFGIRVEHENFVTYKIKGRQSYKGTSYKIEGDWSIAANFLVGAAISGKLEIIGLNPASMQPDKEILTVLKNCGAKINWQHDILKVEHDTLKPFEFDATHYPDLFPPLVVLAAACPGLSMIKGTQRLIYKESNRLETLIETFEKLGVLISVEGDALMVHGTGYVQGNTIQSHNDHRIAMATAIAGTLADGPIKIQEQDAVKKSYPGFFDDLDRCMKRVNGER